MTTPQEVYDVAKTWINGTPYVWGGSSKYANDCSGFVYGAHLEAGAPFDYRTTAEGFRQICEIVDNPEPGDLVFFENTDPDIWNRERVGPDGKIASHIGFVSEYPSTMLDSHDRAGGAVNFTNWDNSYWRPKLIEFRRAPQVNASSVPDQVKELDAWYRAYLAGLIGPEGELHQAVQGVIDNTEEGSDAHTLATSLLDRMNTLWTELSGE